MNELIATLFILFVFVVYIKARDTLRKSYEIMVPRDIQKGAQHAADISQKSQVVVFALGTFEIVRADNQHAARGDIVMVFHPKQDLVLAPRNIYAGAVLKPNPNVEVLAQ